MSAGAPPPPTIVINASSTTALSASQPATQPPSKTSRPQNPVLVESCYLCDEQNPGDFSPTTTFLERCLLCSRHFCPIHRSEDRDQLCNINHASYYHDCLERARQETVAARGQGEGQGEDSKRAIAEILIRDGVFPSLGEREKAIFATSPVTDEKIQELEQYRSLDAALTGATGTKKDQLIEERDVVGADIAV